MRVLVVEDEPTLAASLKRGLVAEGMTVDVADDGEMGLWYAREHAFDVIVLDIMLPKVNGYVVCRTLRDEGDRTPILMLTAKSGELDEAEGLDIGADDYVSKPFSMITLTARLRALARRGPVSRDVVLTAGDLTMDVRQRIVTRAGDAVELTGREFAVLALLLRDPGTVLSKREILDSAWDQAYEGDVNIVEVYVSSLRKKLDSPYGRQAIQTVRGAGYRIDPTGG